MVTTGNMDVERSVDLDPRLAPVADLGRVALGIGRRELAAGITGARDQSGAYLRCLDGNADCLDRGNREFDILVADTRDQQVLPDREPDLAVAEIVGDFCQPAHLRRCDLPE